MKISGQVRKSFCILETIYYLVCHTKITAK
jgi:hypothetical protein